MAGVSVPADATKKELKASPWGTTRTGFLQDATKKELKDITVAMLRRRHNSPDATKKELKDSLRYSRITHLLKLMQLRKN